MTLKPLDGIRVLDLTAFPPGAYCAIMLADLGAEIVHVEPPSLKGKPSIMFGQVAMSRAKRSFALDMRSPAANAVLLRLAASVDVVIENAKPGSMEARGFGYAQARAVHPGIIWCAITGFGQTGPNAGHAGHDLSYMAHSGLLGALSAEQPFHPGTQIAVPLGAMAAVVGIQGALISRMANGEGAFIDISLSEAATWALTGGINPLTETPLVLTATPDRRLYACADGRHIAIACSEPRTWAALCDGLGLPDLKERLHRPEHGESSTQAIAAVFATRPAMEWVENLAPKGAAVTIFNHASEVLDDPHILARGTIAECAGSPVPRSPVRIASPSGDTTAPNLTPPPLTGQDTADVLASAGFSAEEIAALVEAGVVA